MSPEIHVLTGARAGLVVPITGDAALIGRHPDADIRLSPDADLDVSARHAAILRDRDRWLLRDLGSRNGTFLNGSRIEADVPVRAGDRIGLGPDGPVCEFRLPAARDAAASLSAASGAAAAADADSLSAGPGAAGARGIGGTTARVRIEVARRTRPLRVTATVLAGCLVIALAGVIVLVRSQRSSLDRERAAMQQRIDSILDAGDRAIQALQGEIAGLAAALRESQEQVRDARARLASAESRGDAAGAADLERELQAATVALRRQQMAASLDFPAIERRIRPATAVVYVEFHDGVVASATAFAVRPDATLVTAGHAVSGADGTRRPRRIAVQFADSDQVWPARIVANSAAADLAVLKIDNIVGDVPTVGPLNLRPDTIPPGSPVAVIGFPLGGTAAGPGAGGRAATARPLLTAGVLSTLAADLVQVQGYGAAGASGSPIVDAEGQVIAVLFGGRHDPDGQVIVGVPAPAAARLLATVR